MVPSFSPRADGYSFSISARSRFMVTPVICGWRTGGRRSRIYAPSRQFMQTSSHGKTELCTTLMPRCRHLLATSCRYFGSLFCPVLEEMNCKCSFKDLVVPWWLDTEFPRMPPRSVPPVLNTPLNILDQGGSWSQMAD